MSTITTNWLSFTSAVGDGNGIAWDNPSNVHNTSGDGATSSVTAGNTTDLLTVSGTFDLMSMVPAHYALTTIEIQREIQNLSENANLSDNEIFFVKNGTQFGTNQALPDNHPATWTTLITDFSDPAHTKENLSSLGAAFSVMNSSSKYNAVAYLRNVKVRFTFDSTYTPKVFLGNQSPDSLRLGNQTATAIYYGTQLVWLPA